MKWRKLGNYLKIIIKIQKMGIMTKKPNNARNLFNMPPSSNNLFIWSTYLIIGHGIIYYAKKESILISFINRK